MDTVCAKIATESSGYTATDLNFARTFLICRRRANIHVLRVHWGFKIQINLLEGDLLLTSLLLRDEYKLNCHREFLGLQIYR